MGFPSSLVVAVVSYEDKELSSVVAAILGHNMGSPAPEIEPSCILRRGNSIPWELIEAGQEQELKIKESIPFSLIDPQEISFWMIVDNEKANETESAIRLRIESRGPRRQDFYQSAFPDPVVHCGFQVPSRLQYQRSLPPLNSSYRPWFEELTHLFKPWKERIWEEFCNSS